MKITEFTGNLEALSYSFDAKILVRKVTNNFRLRKDSLVNSARWTSSLRQPFLPTIKITIGQSLLGDFTGYKKDKDEKKSMDYGLD